MAAIKFKIYSLGCKVNQYDGGELGGLLKSAGFILVKDSADIAIVNSCAVTAGAIAKNKWMINKARTENPRAKIILTGCWPRVYGEEVKKIGVDLVWPRNNLKGLVKKLNYDWAKKYTKYQILNTKYKKADKNASSSNILSDNQDKSRYFLKIQDGCEQFCSYCIIPFTRGKLQSRLMSDVLAEAEAAVKKGYREIVLCGIHLGFFGINNVGNRPTPPRRARHPSQEGNSKSGNLLELLEQLVKIEDLQRIRLSSIEITEVSGELVDFMAREKKMCQHLHIPLQSGCDKILRLMKRPYDLEFFAGKIRKLRKKMPDIAISTDVIVGFPGETSQDFAATGKFIKKIKFSRLHVFSFFPHALTAAAKLPGRVEAKEVKTRSAILRKLSDEMAAKFIKKFQGKILEVVVEHNRSSRTGILKGKKMKGKTEYYFDVFFNKKDILGPAGVRGKTTAELIGRVVKMKNAGRS